MASTLTTSNEKSSPSNSESESDSESDSCDDIESTESLSSFDQSEEEDHLTSEDIIEQPASGQLPCEFEVNEEKSSEVEATDINSCELERSGEALPKGNFPFLHPFFSSLSFSISLNNIDAFKHFLFHIRKNCCFIVDYLNGLLG